MFKHLFDVLVCSKITVPINTNVHKNIPSDLPIPSLNQEKN